MDAVRIFLPSASQIVDYIFIESFSGDLYSITSIIGSDLEFGEEIFVISRSTYCEKDFPTGGSWWNVDRECTKLRTEYRYRQGRAYKDFQELHDVQFRSGDEIITLRRKADDFGVEKLMVEFRVADN
jgi:hypothetical protein